MKKLITIIATVFFALSSIAVADDLELLYGESDIYYVMDVNDEWDSQIDLHYELRNNTDKEMTVETTIFIDNLAFGHVLSFCYELCYNVPKSGEFSVPFELVLPPGKTVKDVIGDDIKFSITGSDYPSPRTGGMGDVRLQFCVKGSETCLELSLNYKLEIGQVSEEPVLAAYEDEINLTAGMDETTTKKVTITNSGKKPVEITASSLIGDDAASFSIIDDTQFPITLERGYSHSLEVSFSPNNEKMEQAFLTFESNAENSNDFKVTLKGNEQLSVADEALKSTKVYPTPASNILNIEMSKLYNDCSILIFDVAGNKLIEQTLTQSSQISIEKLSVGSYFYKIKNGLDYSDAVSFVVVR